MNQMNSSSKDLGRYALVFIYISLILMFYTNNEQLENAAYIMFIFVTGSFLLSNKHLYLSDNIGIGGLVVLGACLIGSALFAKYSQLYTILCFVILFILMQYSENYMDTKSISLLVVDCFYYYLLILASFQIIRGSVQGDLQVFYTSLGNKNYTEIMVFIIFLLANKRKHISGILFGVVYGLIFSSGRSYLLLLILFYLVDYFNEKIEKIFLKIHFSIRKLFVLTFIFIAIFSPIWVYHISASSYSGYRESLNDLSNRIRFIANINAYNHLIQPSKTFLWGYGTSILDALGISGETYITHSYLLGVRVVQPHNCELNLMLKMGIVPSIIYLSVLGKFWNKLLVRKNYAYLIPYIIDSMFMHSLFSTKWLILFTLVLLIPEKKWSIKVRL